MVTTASIYLFGDNLQPEKITELLGVECSHSQIRGGRRSTDPKGKYAPAKAGLWRLEGLHELTSLPKQLDAIFGRLEGVNIRLDKIEDVESAELDVFVTDEKDGPRQELAVEFSNSQIGRIHQLGLSLKITVM
jgi:hypothetical protein